MISLVLEFLEVVKEVASSSQAVMTTTTLRSPTGSDWFHGHFIIEWSITRRKEAKLWFLQNPRWLTIDEDNTTVLDATV